MITDMKSEAVEATVVAKAENIKPRQTVYIGPLVIKYGLIPNKIFKDGVPVNYPLFKGLFDKFNLLKFLFVEPSVLREKKEACKKSGTLENQAILQLLGGIAEDGNV